MKRSKFYFNLLAGALLFGYAFLIIIDKILFGGDTGFGLMYSFMIGITVTIVLVIIIAMGYENKLKRAKNMENVLNKTGEVVIADKNIK